MKKFAFVEVAVLLLFVSAFVLAQSPRAATYITAEQVKAVNALPGVDRQIVSVDIGSVVKRVVGPGDLVIIPATVPHGWINITDHVDYLSVRPDPDRVLPAGYVNPAIKK